MIKNITVDTFEYLFYFILSENLENILKYGICPKNYILEKKIETSSFALESVQNRRHFKEIPFKNGKVFTVHDFVPLYFCPKTPAQYYIKDQEKNIVFFLIKKDSVLTANDYFCFSDGNMASYDTKIYYDVKDLKMLDWDCISAQYWTNYEDGKRKKCSEFLVNPKVTCNHIDRIVVYDKYMQSKISFILHEYGFVIPVVIDENFYFYPNQRRLKSSDDFILNKDIKINMVRIPSGSFQRDEEADNISIVSAFRMSENEITREQLEKVMGYDPSDTKNSTGQQDPVQCVNWYHALVFCNKLSLLEGLTPVYTLNGSTDPAQWGSVPTSSNSSSWDAVLADWSADGYRLPTEMEWMWVAMGADKDNPGKVNTKGYTKKFAGSNGSHKIDDYAWYDKNSNRSTHPVGMKQPNELGIYDMSGNVWEWCWDWYGNYPSGSTTNYRGAASGNYRVFRGGSWYFIASLASIANRFINYPYRRYNDLGFRVVRP